MVIMVVIGNHCDYDPDKKSPQYFKVASNNVWNTILYPITSEMIKGEIDITATIKDLIPL